jgi:hypothetical protein
VWCDSSLWYIKGDIFLRGGNSYITHEVRTSFTEELKHQQRFQFLPIFCTWQPGILTRAMYALRYEILTNESAK